LYIGGRVKFEKLVNKHSFKHVNRGSRLDFLTVLSTPSKKFALNSKDPLLFVSRYAIVEKLFLILKLNKFLVQFG
jgi:hypothetical protein